MFFFEWCVFAVSWFITYLPLLADAYIWNNAASILINMFNMLLTSYIFYYSYAIKFLFVLMLLIFIRGGTPRYRLDFLTKLGWSKFNLWIIFIYLTLFIVVWLF